MQNRRERDEMGETSETDGTNLRVVIKEDRVTGRGTVMKSLEVKEHERIMILKGGKAVVRIALRVKMIAQSIKMIMKIGTKKN